MSSLALTAPRAKGARARPPSLGSPALPNQVQRQPSLTGALRYAQPRAPGHQRARARARTAKHQVGCGVLHLGARGCGAAQQVPHAHAGALRVAAGRHLHHQQPAVVGLCRAGAARVGRSSRGGGAARPLPRSPCNLPLARPACAVGVRSAGCRVEAWARACLARGRAIGTGESVRGAEARAVARAADAPSKVSPRGSVTSGVSTRLPGATSGTSTASTASPTSTCRRPQRPAQHRAQQAACRSTKPCSSRPSPNHRAQAAAAGHLHASGRRRRFGGALPAGARAAEPPGWRRRRARGGKRMKAPVLRPRDAGAAAERATSHVHHGRMPFYTAAASLEDVK